MKKINKEKVFWWSPKNRFRIPFYQKENVGDFLGPQLVEKILFEKNIDINVSERRVLTVGSIMHYSRPGDVIWGTGINGKMPMSLLSFSGLDIRAVRGPMTRDVLLGLGEQVPSVYGDPGILTSIFWPRCKSPIKGRIVYIPHMREKVTKSVKKSFKVVSPLLDLKTFLDEIQLAEKVVTTSLHGFILSETYGVPVSLLMNDTGETVFKYEDYYQGTGRQGIPIYESLDEAMEYQNQYFDFSVMQEQLLNSFPYEVWIGKK